MVALVIIVIIILITLIIHIILTSGRAQLVAREGGKPVEELLRSS